LTIATNEEEGKLQGNEANDDIKFDEEVDCAGEATGKGIAGRIADVSLRTTW